VSFYFIVIAWLLHSGFANFGIIIMSPVQILVFDNVYRIFEGHLMAKICRYSKKKR
jgi:hypothetical protein